MVYISNKEFNITAKHKFILNIVFLRFYLLDIFLDHFVHILKCTKYNSSNNNIDVITGTMEITDCSNNKKKKKKKWFLFDEFASNYYYRFNILSASVFYGHEYALLNIQDGNNLILLMRELKCCPADLKRNEKKT